MIEGNITVEDVKKVYDPSVFENFERLKEEVNRIETTGICWNWTKEGFHGVNEDTEECSVGIVRKMRNEVARDNKYCQTCPYYISKEILLELLNCIENRKCGKLEGLVLKRHEFLYSRDFLY
ncbi:hypothetical protein A3L04_09550 [Thermococcus chitonophagus]|uniref:Uncharacterized protein n=1 Tax=Thermococcus chitonophagus TaxID=54262 RepID=A0A2Z2N5F0_9EURY|nr:hypothetical protein A3L04_09550 [Thermococcus chitonophagus]